MMEDISLMVVQAVVVMAGLYDGPKPQPLPAVQWQPRVAQIQEVEEVVQAVGTTQYLMILAMVVRVLS